MLCPPGAKAFLLVTDNRRSRPDSPFCVITQHRKFEFGHHRQSKKISNAQELTVQLSQTLSSTMAQIKVSNSPLTNQAKKILPQSPPPFFNFCIKINFLQIVSMGEGFPVYRFILPPGQLAPGGEDTRGQLAPRGAKFPWVSSPPPWVS